MSSIDELLNEANDAVYQAIEKKQADPRLIGLAIEANQRYIEYLDQVQAQNPRDSSITIQIDKGTAVRFESDQQLADWLSGRMDP